MQRIVEFKKRHFWTSNIDMESLNQKMEQLNQDGWSSTSFLIPLLSEPSPHTLSCLRTNNKISHFPTVLIAVYGSHL